MKPRFEIDAMTHDPDDPNPWLALFLDQSVPFNDGVKRAWLIDSSSPSRQYLLPLVRPLARLAIVLLQLVKLFVPRHWRASATLHALLAWGLKRFVRPEANWLILRHFWLGSEILDFIARNSGTDVPTSPLKPNSIDALRDEVFLKHDLNLYNFIIRLNQSLRKQGRGLSAPDRLDFDGISDSGPRLDDMPRQWTNVLDLQTAIELFAPVYQLFLSDDDFWRATNSLQLDETIGLYCATLINADGRHLALINNKHPLLPESTLRAGYRLALHGLATESLHALLLALKAEQARQDASRTSGPR
ncbi:MAG: hypothetical protein EA418_12090 [Wenzhouxiangellaceae bacterium]|nr:MAG: hypothetical protein EA418_12090 [Wenzhouxiangellaceae bacterium]